jgi:hypothetical protein
MEAKYTPAEIATVTPEIEAIAKKVCKYNGQTGTKAQVFKRLEAAGYFMDGIEGRIHAAFFLTKYCSDMNV